METPQRINCATHKCKRLARAWFNLDTWCLQDLKRVMKIYAEREPGIERAKLEINRLILKIKQGR